MSDISRKLAKCHESGRLIRVGLIGCGKFGSMYLSQAHRTPGIHLVGVADLDMNRAISALHHVGFPTDRYLTSVADQPSLLEAMKSGKTVVTSDSTALLATPELDVVLECTGSPAAGVRHALLAFEKKKHIVMVNVEADVLAGPLLSRLAREAGVIYSMAYGDQPALIAELVDWARTAGFEVVCAGKGTKHLPEYHFSTPKTVWDYYGLGEVQRKDLNPQMFNSFLDGTKSAIEMAAVANACDLVPPSKGLMFPPCGAHDLPKLLKPKSNGGLLQQSGTVEVVSCLEKDGRNVFNDLRWGVYVVIKASGEYQKECFAQYGLLTDESGWYAAQYKPYHLVGLELGISVANIMLRGEPTGQCRAFTADVVATAKKDLSIGQTLDGEGGFCVYGTLMSAVDSLDFEGLPIGLAHGVRLKQKILKGQKISWKDVEFDEERQEVKIRRLMEQEFRQGP